jgi:hypothetical protein
MKGRWMKRPVRRDRANGEAWDPVVSSVGGRSLPVGLLCKRLTALAQIARDYAVIADLLIQYNRLHDAARAVHGLRMEDVRQATIAFLPIEHSLRVLN